MDQGPQENVTPAAPAAPSGPARRRRVTRRKALKYGLAGTAGLAGAGALAHVLLRSGGPGSWSMAPSAEVFKNDAPTGELWQQWRKRGWARQAMHYRPRGRNIRCKLCPNDCLLEPNDRGRCRNRVHKDGKLYTMAYGNPCSFTIDPIEKKPLYHFQPGTWIFSIATSGCGFRCLNCQNWDISQRKPEETKDPRGAEVRMKPEWLFDRDVRARGARISIFPADVAEIAKYYADHPFFPGHPEFRCRSVAYTYSEPTAYYEYMLDSARLAREKGLKNVWVTCGYIHREPLEQLCEHLDAANVDLKSFDDATYRKLNSGKLRPILDTLKTLKERGVWFEVTNLVVPTYTDDLDMIRRMCGWLVENLGPDYPLHFSRFHPHHKLTHLPPTSPEVLLKAREIARKAGLHYVYLGNVGHLIRRHPELIDAGTTYCPRCHKPVLERYGYVLRQVQVKEGKCALCGAPLAGVWSA